MPSVFLLGATGFLGGTVLTDLQKDGSYEITALVRSGKEQLVSARGVRVVTGSFSDLALIEQTSSAHDIVINAADSDDLPLTQREEGVLVHVSGTQLIESPPTGNLDEGWPVYDDSNLEQIKGIDELALHREIDLEIARADLSGEIIASIICPGLIYGLGTGPDKIISALTPSMMSLAMKRGQVVVAGRGTNVWPDVHVQDVVDLIMLSLRHNLATSKPAGFERFYFAENGEHAKLPYSRTLASLLSDKNLVRTTDILHVPAGDTRAPGWANNTTSRCRATRARRDLGWKPRWRMDEEGLGRDVRDILEVWGK
ncbi:hypothetical protein EHS25_003642 [Saitozyma podzolica]|uniref:Uncharacterized protein n=1 Tax=Saitozyma podzolica TaxID=1890683 RepID=A0A427Y7U3_9TREE|nr:hypothetical protein EHS25_003642 [Saitozyma podzolica]